MSDMRVGSAAWMRRQDALTAISVERDRQDALFPEQAPSERIHSLKDHTMVSVLVEEVGEVAKAALEADEVELRTELVQAAAVCVKWLEILGAEHAPHPDILAYTEEAVREIQIPSAGDAFARGPGVEFDPASEGFAEGQEGEA